MRLWLPSYDSRQQAMRAELDELDIRRRVAPIAYLTLAQANALYSQLTHDHSALYSVLSHLHDDLYSQLTHDHGAGGGSQVDHGSLTGLNDDDHPQYFQLAGRAGGLVAADEMNGRLGAGILVPLYPVHAKNATADQVISETSGAAGSASAGFITTGKTGAVGVGGPSHATLADNLFLYFDGAARVLINASGQVGINVAPTCRLDVAETGGAAADKKVAQHHVTDLGSTRFVYALLGKADATDQSFALGYRYNSTAGSAYGFLCMNGETPGSADVEYYKGGSWLARGYLKTASPTLGLGYATGAGGTGTTQATSKATDITCNKVCGSVTTHNAALAAGADVSFRVLNSTVAATDVVIVNVASGGTTNTYVLGVESVTAGAFRIIMTNVSTTSRSENVVINFAVIKAVTA